MFLLTVLMTVFFLNRIEIKILIELKIKKQTAFEEKKKRKETRKI